MVLLSSAVAGAGALLLHMGTQYASLRSEALSGASAHLLHAPFGSHPSSVSAQTLDQILMQTDLAAPYIPTPWAAGRFSNLALFELKKRLTIASRRTPFARQTLSSSTDLAIDWLDTAATRELPADAPLLVVLHTISGSAPQQHWLLAEAERRGWRGCVLVRRGHTGEPLREAPSFNLLGDVADARAQLKAAREAYPSASFCAAVGVSAGSGLLVSVLGREGAAAAAKGIDESNQESNDESNQESNDESNDGSNYESNDEPHARNRVSIRSDPSTHVDAAVGLCPAYDVSTSFDHLQIEFPLTERLMLSQLKRLFLVPNARILRSLSAHAYDACLHATTLPQLFAAHAPFACGHADADARDYFERFNPMHVCEHVRVPLLLVNSDDDMVCPPGSVREDLVRETAGVALLRTRRGSHCAYSEGLFGEGSYAARVAMGFLDAAHTVSLRGREGGRGTALESEFAAVARRYSATEIASRQIRKEILARARRGSRQRLVKRRDS